MLRHRALGGLWAARLSGICCPGSVKGGKALGSSMRLRLILPGGSEVTQEAERGLLWITSTGLWTHCVCFMPDRSSSLERTWHQSLCFLRRPWWTPGLGQPRLRHWGCRWGHGHACQPQRGSLPGCTGQHGSLHVSSTNRLQLPHAPPSVSFRGAKGPAHLRVLPAASSSFAPALSFCVTGFPMPHASWSQTQGAFGLSQLDC